MLHRNDLMLLRIAQGDAYAMAAEYCARHPDEPEYHELREVKRYLSHPTYHKLPSGTYTDDTQMSIAVAECLINDAADRRYGLPNCWTTKDAFSESFFKVFKRDPRDGYSRGLQVVLETAQDWRHMVDLIDGKSTKNGAAMRSVPLGVIKDLSELKAVAYRQASVTHNTPEGITSSVGVALMSHYALHEAQDFSGLVDWLVPHHSAFGYFRRPWEGPVVSKVEFSPYDVGMNTAWAACTLLQQESSLMGIMRRIIDWGGDTDSIAAIAWGIASARYQHEMLPYFLERDLEAKGNPRYGAQFLTDLGTRLMDAYG